MLTDVLFHRRLESIAAIFPDGKPAAQVGCRDGVLNRLDPMDPFALSLGEVKGGQVDERRARSTDNNPFGECEQPLRLPPLTQREEAVGSHQAEDRRCRHLGAESCQGIDRVVGGTVWEWGIYS